LDVAVNHAAFVREIERAANGNDVVEFFLNRESRASFDEAFEAFAFEKFHRDEGRLAFLAELVDGDDVRMLQRAGGARLLIEAFKQVRVACKPLRDRFQSDEAADERILGL
ncbi:MAG TPA: hypothetical protein VN727_01265, partial [Candidatus Binatia bacterium]|nr:hypothetical protein [Candidatus Binatia bacterium]